MKNLLVVMCAMVIVGGYTYNALGESLDLMSCGKINTTSEMGGCSSTYITNYRAGIWAVHCSELLGADCSKMGKGWRCEVHGLNIKPKVVKLSTDQWKNTAKRYTLICGKCEAKGGWMECKKTERK